MYLQQQNKNKTEQVVLLYTTYSHNVSLFICKQLISKELFIPLSLSRPINITYHIIFLYQNLLTQFENSPILDTCHHR